MGSSIVICEDTALVRLRAGVEQGTGEYQALSSDPNNTSAVAVLQECQGALAAYKVIPQEVWLDIFQPGVLPGQQLTLDPVDSPTGIAALIGDGAQWVVLEVQAKFLVPRDSMPDLPGLSPAGYFQYTLHLMDQAQIGTYLDFWLGLGGGSSGAGSGLAGAGFLGTPGGGGGTAVDGPVTTLALGSGDTFTPVLATGRFNRVVLSTTSPKTVYRLGQPVGVNMLWVLYVDQDGVYGGTLYGLNVLVFDPTYNYAGNPLGSASPGTRSALTCVTDQGGFTTVIAYMTELRAVAP
jgi:hypothetical protein